MLFKIEFAVEVDTEQFNRFAATYLLHDIQGDPKNYQIENLNKFNNIYYNRMNFLLNQVKSMHGFSVKFEVYSMKNVYFMGYQKIGEKCTSTGWRRIRTRHDFFENFLILIYRLDFTF